MSEQSSITRVIGFLKPQNQSCKKTSLDQIFVKMQKKQVWARFLLSYKKTSLDLIFAT